MVMSVPVHPSVLLRSFLLGITMLGYASQSEEIRTLHAKELDSSRLHVVADHSLPLRFENLSVLRPLGLLLLAFQSLDMGQGSRVLHANRLNSLSRVHLPILSEVPSRAPSEMRLKEIKEELDARGVKWRDVYFDKDQLVDLLEEVRLLSPAPAKGDGNSCCPPGSGAENVENDLADTEVRNTNACCAPPTSATSRDDGQGSNDQVSSAVGSDRIAQYEVAYNSARDDAKKMKTKELRTAIVERGGRWADCIEKSELEARLAELVANASIFSASGALTPGMVTQVNANQLRQEIAEVRTPLVIDVFATWCGPCQMIAPMLEQIASEGGDRFRMVKLDTDVESQMSAELGVTGFPTIIFYRDGKEVYRLEGVPQSVDTLKSLVGNHLGVVL